MNPDILALDRALARTGEPVMLRRITGTTNQSWVDVEVMALVRGYRPEQLVGGIVQTDSLVILSPTSIFGAQWPGGVVPGSTVDARLPKKGDKAIIRGAARNVETVGPIYSRGELVRIEMRVLG
jgi:hypothetical protein